jgi:hypothetical protein
MNFILQGLLSIGGTLFQDWQASRQNKREVERAVTENRIRLAVSEQEHNQGWEMRALEGRDNVLRRVSFLIWSAPMLWAAWDPQGATAYFRDALGALPEWYVYGYLAISGAVWGISEMKGMGLLKGGK